MNILGIHDGHVASVALLIDGKIVKVIEEERLTRIKGDSGFPIKSLEYLKQHSPEDLENIDHVAIASYNHDLSLFATKRYPCFGIKDF
jgi:carbamoyltransferase